MNEKLAFVAKVAVVHVVTYTLCGLLAMALFDYQDAVQAAGMRPVDDLAVQLAPLFQIVRVALFGVVLWLLRPAYLHRSHDWLVVQAAIVVLGIFNTPATSPGSLEALVYLEPTGASWSTSVGGMAEILVQTLAFSAVATWWVRRPPSVSRPRSPRS